MKRWVHMVLLGFSLCASSRAQALDISSNAYANVLAVPTTTGDNATEPERCVIARMRGLQVLQIIEVGCPPRYAHVPLPRRKPLTNDRLATQK